ncbi:MAG TPA: asparagine synthase (glutamine-hydrolyzing), partial [Candidatus Dormibacteraeota bacterium]|nr:asparagine synthase (glutamine-hydrolyzing) [Candidatus Dormibacteraeota bacterium]
MCGICGIAGGDPRRHRELVQRICAAMVHRGPDDEGFVVGDDVALGMRRLSIIDVDGGHQPMANEDSTVWVVQNGEIYNHLELRSQLIAAGHVFRTRSDTEVLVHAYEEWGETMVERLNGMFAFAVNDRRSRIVFLARDRMGIKPLYHATDGRTLFFASELKALLRVPELRREVDRHALDEYLAYEFVPSPRSIVTGISKLRAGHTLTWSIDDGAERVHRYWSPQLNAGDGRRDLDAEASQLLDVMRESVRKELISDVPLGVFLSGGI